MKTERNAMKLHIGCGMRNFGKGWYHVDVADFPHIDSKDIYLNEFDEQSADLIYSAHMIEYLDRDAVRLLLKSWYSVLNHGGTLRLAVPDFDAMAQLYAFGRCTLSEILGPLYGKMVIAGKDKVVYHRTVYDFASLQMILKEIGFTNVRRYDWRLTDHAVYDDHSQAYLCPKGDKEKGVLISLNIECEKP